MPTVFWTGKLTPTVKLLVNFSNTLAWITGNARYTVAMKRRMKLGYDGVVSDHVSRYDDVGLEHYTETGKALLEPVNLRGEAVLDVGCGTGILAFLALEKGAGKVVCGDLSQYMLDQCRRMAADLGYAKDIIDFRQLDAESLPFDESSFDTVMSGLVLGLVPNQKKMVSEMVRVLRSGGTLCFSTHGPEYYYEAGDAAFRAIPKRFVLGYRLEFWPRQEKEIGQILSQAGLADILTRRLTWQEEFSSGGEAYDFFASTSASWWYAKFPPDRIAEVSQRIRDYFERKRVQQITMDTVLAYGQKP
jgi:ubiquinone/menaquinone biosynthesis C-methylase UbiE